MAKYQSRVTNKYMGAGNKGAVNIKPNSQWAELSNALAEFNPKMQKWGTDFVDRKKQDASIELKALYATGKSDEDVRKIIMSGENSKLSNMYAESVVDAFEGQYHATETIRQIEEARSNYDLTTMKWEEFTKDFIPNMENSSTKFKAGFASVFESFQSDNLIKDAQAKGAFHHGEKLKKAMSVANTQRDATANGYEGLWTSLNNMTVEMPSFDGAKGNQYLSTADINAVAKQLAQKTLLEARSQEDLDWAEYILTSERGKGKGGNDLGSLADTNDLEVSKMLNQIEATRTSMENEEYTQNQRAMQTEKRNYLDDVSALMFGGTMSDGTEVEVDMIEANKLMLKMQDAYPELGSSVLQMVNVNRALNENKGAIDDIYIRAQKGDFVDNWEGMFQEFVEAGGTMESFSALQTAYSYAEQRKAKGMTLDPVNEDAYWNKTKTYMENLIHANAIKFSKFESDGEKYILTNEVNNLIESEVNEWYLENAEPTDKMTNPDAWKEWNKERKEFTRDLEHRLTNQFSNEDYMDSLQQLANANKIQGIDFNNVLDEAETIRYEQATSSFSLDDEIAGASFQSHISRIMNEEFVNEIEAIKQIPDLALLAEEYGKSIDEVAMRMAEVWGIEARDMSEVAEVYNQEIMNVTEGKSENLQTILADKSFWSTFSFQDENQMSVNAFKNQLNNSFRLITGRDLNSNVFNALSDEAVASLATYYNMSVEDLEKQVAEYF